MVTPGINMEMKDTRKYYTPIKIRFRIPRTSFYSYITFKADFWRIVGGCQAGFCYL